MTIRELITALENIGDTNGDVDVYVTNLGTGTSGKIVSVDNDYDKIEIFVRHMDIDLEEDS